jgi:FKBP12-rapamycin complex-associated protein
LQDVGAPSKRRAAVITLGQICQSAGCVMTPYWDFPQLLALLLRLLHEGNPSKGRCEVMRVLGKWRLCCWPCRYYTFYGFAALLWF